MENRYRWDSDGVQGLRDATQTAHDALVRASVLVNDIVADIDDDCGWTGAHKDAFWGWMRLLASCHAQMADEGVGKAAVTALDGFAAELSGFYQGSRAYATLRGVG